MNRAIRVRDNTRRLYKLMPGAKHPPWDEVRGYLWGEVEDTPEYDFCAMIARMIDDVDTRVHVDGD